MAFSPLFWPARPSFCPFPPLLLSFPKFIAGIHGRAWRPQILVIEESVASLNTVSRGAACSRGSKGPSPRPLSQGEREWTGGLFASLLAYPRKRKAGVGIVADGGTYKNAGFPIKDVGNDRRDHGGNDRLATLPAPLLAFPTPPSVIPRPLLLSFPQFLAGIHVGRVRRGPTSSRSCHDKPSSQPAHPPSFPPDHPAHPSPPVILPLPCHSERSACPEPRRE